MAKAPILLSWEIEEYTHREKGPDWYWALGVVAIAGAAMAVIFHDVLFAVFIILAAVILGYYAARKPEIINISISDDGIQIRSFFYPFDKVKGFAVDENELGDHLLIEVDRLVTPVISITLPFTVDPDDLRALLKARTTELPLKEKMSHRLMEHMGF